MCFAREAAIWKTPPKAEAAAAWAATLSLNNSGSRRGSSSNKGAAAGRWQGKWTSGKSFRMAAADSVERNLTTRNHVTTEHPQMSLPGSSSSSSTDAAAEQLPSHQGAHRSSTASLPPHSRTCANSAYVQASPESCTCVVGGSRNGATAVYSAQLVGREDISKAPAAANISYTNSPSRHGEGVSSRAGAGRSFPASTAIPIDPRSRHTDRASMAVDSPGADASSSTTAGLQWISRSVHGARHSPSASLRARVDNSCSDTVTHATLATVPPYSSNYPAGGSASPGSQSERNFTAVGSRPSAFCPVGCCTSYTAAASPPEHLMDNSGKSRAMTRLFGRHDASPIQTSYCEARTSRRSPVEVSRSRTVDTPPTRSRTHRADTVDHSNARAASHPACSAARVEHRKMEPLEGACMHFPSQELGVVGAATQHHQSSPAARGQVASCAVAASGIAAAVMPCAVAPCTAPAAAYEGNVAAIAAGVIRPAAASAFLSIVEGGGSAGANLQTDSAVFRYAVATCAAADSIPEDRRLQQQEQSGKDVAPVLNDQLLSEELFLSDTLTPLEAAEVRDSRAEKVPLGEPSAVQHAATAAQSILQQLSMDMIEAPAGTSNDSVMGEEDTASKALCKSESSRVYQTRDQHVTPSPSWSCAGRLAKEKTPQPRDRSVLGRQLTAGFQGGAAAAVPCGSEVAAAARPSSALVGAVPHSEYRSDSSAGARAQTAPRVQASAAAAATITASPQLPAAPPPAAIAPTAADKEVSVAGRAGLGTAASLPAANVSAEESYAGPDVSAGKCTASPQGGAAGYCQTHVSPPLVPENPEQQICRSRACSSSAPAQQETPNRRTSHTVLESRRTAAGVTVSAVGGPSAAGDTPSVELSVGLPYGAAAAAACAEVHAAVARPVTTGGSNRSCSVKNSSSPAIRSSDCTTESSSRWVRTTVGRPIHRASSSAAKKPTPSSLLSSTHRSSSGRSSRPDLVNSTPTNVSKYGVRRMKKSSVRASSSGDGSKSPQMNDGRGGGQVAASPEERTLFKGERHTLIMSRETNEPRILNSQQQQERPVFHGAGLPARTSEQIARREQADGQDERAVEEAAAVQQPHPADKHVSPTLGKEICITVGQQGHPPAAWPQELPTAAAGGEVADLWQRHEQMFDTSPRERRRQKEAAAGSREQRGEDQGAAGSEHRQERRAVLYQLQRQQPTLPLQQQQQQQKGGLLQQIGMPQQQSQPVEEGLQLWQHVLQQHVDQPPQVRVVATPPCTASQRQQSQWLGEKEQEEAPKQLTQQRFKNRELLQQPNDTVFLRRRVTPGGAGVEEGKAGITAKVATCAGPKSPTSSSSALAASSCWPSSYVSSTQQVFVSYSLPSSGGATSFPRAASLQSSLCGSSVDLTFSERNSFASTGHYSCRSSHGSSAFLSPGSGASASPSFPHGASSEANNESNACLDASSSSCLSFDISRWRVPHPCPQPRPSQYSAACENAEATAGREAARERTRAAAAAAPVAIDVIPPAAPRVSAGREAASVERGRHGKSSLATAAARSGLRLLEELTELPGPEGQHARTLACFLRRHTGTEVVSSGPSEAAIAGAATSSIPTTLSSCSKLPLFYPAATSFSKQATHTNRLNIGSSRDAPCGCLSCGTMAAGCPHAQAAGDSSRSSYERRDPTACSCEERKFPPRTSRGGHRTGRETGKTSNSDIRGASSAPSSSVAGDSRSRSAAARLGEEASRPAAAAGLSLLGLNLCSVDETARRSSAATATTVASGSETLKDTQTQLVAAEDQLVPKPGQRTSTLLPQATGNQRRFGQEQRPQPRPRRDLVGQQETRAAAAHAPAVNAELSGAGAAAAADEAFSKQADERQPSLAAAVASSVWSRRLAESLSSVSMTSVPGGGSHASGSLSDGAFYDLKRHADPGGGEQSDMSGEGSFESALSSKGLHLAERSSQCSSDDRREQKSSGALQLSGSTAETFVEHHLAGSSSARVSGSNSVSAHRIEGRATQLVGSCEELLLPSEQMEQSRHTEQQPQREPESQDAPATEASWESEGSRRPWKMTLDVPRLLVAAAAAVGRNYWSYFGRTNTTPASSERGVVDAAASAAVGGRTQQSPAGDDNPSLTTAMRSSLRRGAQQDGFCEAGIAARRLRSMPAELRKHSSQWGDGSAAAGAQAEKRRSDDVKTPAAGQETERRQPSAAYAAASHEKSDFVAGVATAAAVQSNVAAAARCCGLAALQKQHAVGTTTTTIICGAEEKVLCAKEQGGEQKKGEKNVQLCRASPSQHEEGLQQRLATGAAARPRRSTCRFCRARAATNYQLHQQSAVERGGALAAGPPQLPCRSLQLVRRRSKRRSSSRSRSSSGAGMVRIRSRWSRTSRRGGGSRSSSASSAWWTASSGRKGRDSTSGSNDSTAGEIRRERAAQSQRERNASSFRTVVAAREMWRESRWRPELSVDRRVSSEGDTGFTFSSLTLRKKLWTTATTPAAICSCSGFTVPRDLTQQEGGHTGEQQAVTGGVGLPAESNSFFYSVSSRRFAEIDAHARNAAAAAGSGYLEAPTGYPADLTESSPQSSAPLASRQPYRRRRHGRRLHGARRRPEESGELDGADSKTVVGAAGEKKRPAAAAAEGGVQTYNTRAAQLGLLHSGRSGDDEEGRGTAEEGLRDSSLLISHEASAAAASSNVSRHKWEVTGIGAVDGRRRTTQAHFFSRGGAYDLSTLWPSHQHEELRRGVLWWFRRDVRSSYLSFSSWFGVGSERSADTNSERSEDPSPQHQQQKQQEDEEAPPHTASPRAHHAQAATHRGPTDKRTTPARDAVTARGRTISAETGGASAAGPTGAAAAVTPLPQHIRTSKRATNGSKTTSAAIGPLTPTTARSTYVGHRAEEASGSVAEQWLVDFREPSAGPSGRFVAADLSQQAVVSSEGRMDSVQDEQETEDVEVKVDASEGRRRGETAAAGERSPRFAGASTGQPQRLTSLWPRIAAELRALQGRASEEASAAAEESVSRSVGEAHIAGALSRISVALRKEEDRWPSWSSQVAALSHSPRLSFWGTSRRGSRETLPPQQEDETPSGVFERDTAAAADDDAGKKEGSATKRRASRHLSGGQQEEIKATASPQESSSEASRSVVAAGSAVAGDATAAAEAGVQPAAQTRWPASAPGTTASVPVAATTDARETQAAPAAAKERGVGLAAATEGRGDVVTAVQRVGDGSRQQTTLSVGAAENVGGLLCRVSSCSWVNPPARRPCRMQRILAKAQKRDLKLFLRRHLRALSSNTGGAAEIRDQSTSSSSSGGDSSDDEEGGRNSWSRDVAAVASTPPTSPSLVRSPKGRAVSSAYSLKKRGSTSETLTDSYASAAAHASPHGESGSTATFGWSTSDRDGSVSTRSSSVRVVREQEKYRDVTQYDSWMEPRAAYSLETSSSVQQLSHQVTTLSREPCSGRDDTEAAPPRGAPRETAVGSAPRLRAALQRSNTIPFASEEAYRSPGVVAGACGGRLAPGTTELSECLRAFPQCILEALIRDTRSSSWQEQQRQLLRCRRHLQKHRRRLQAREPSMKVVHSSRGSLGDWQLIPTRSKSDSPAALPKTIVSGERGGKDLAKPGGGRREQRQEAAVADEDGNGRQTQGGGAVKGIPTATSAAEGPAAAAAAIPRGRFVLKSVKRNVHDSAGGLEEGLYPDEKEVGPLDERGDSAVAAAAAARSSAAAGGREAAALAGSAPAAAGNAAAGATGKRQLQGSIRVTPSSSERPIFLSDQWRVRDTVRGRTASGPPEAFRDSRKGAGDGGQGSTSASPVLPRSNARPAVGRQAVGDGTEKTASRERLSLWLGAHSIPRDDKRYRGGEDAWFLSSTCNAMGVADGVSEWEDLAGINPQKFAQDLMRGTFKHLRRLKKLKALGLIQGIRAAAAQRNSEKKAAAATKKTEGSPGTGQPARPAGGVGARGQEAGAGNALPKGATAAAEEGAGRAQDDEKNGGGVKEDGEEMKRGESPDAAAAGESCASLDAAEMARVALTWSYHEAKHYGSSTALVGVLDERTGVIGFANLGDSSGMVLRRLRRGGSDASAGQPTLGVVRRVKEMQHSFNVPYQFGHVPAPEDWSRLRSTGLERLVSIAEKDFRQRCNQAEVADGTGRECAESAIGDLPTAIEKLTVRVQEGDLILIGTDGLFDNVFDYEITALSGLAVSPAEAKKLFLSTSHATPPSEVARALALAAYWRSLDPTAQTPFSKETKKQLNLHGGTGEQDGWRSYLGRFAVGGKEDDITVVAAWVVTEADATPGLIGTGVVPGESLSQEEEEMLLVDEDD